MTDALQRLMDEETEALVRTIQGGAPSRSVAVFCFVLEDDQQRDSVSSGGYFGPDEAANIASMSLRMIAHVIDSWIGERCEDRDLEP